MPDPHSPSELAPVARAFVQHHRIPSSAIRTGGRVVLTVDQRYRIHLFPAPHQRLALQAELMPVPDFADRPIDDTLWRLARAAAGLLPDQASTLAIDERRGALVLQQSIPAAAELAVLEEAIAAFTNALAFWTRLVKAETAQRAGVPA